MKLLGPPQGNQLRSSTEVLTLERVDFRDGKCSSNFPCGGGVADRVLCFLPKSPHLSSFLGPIPEALWGFM